MKLAIREFFIWKVIIISLFIVFSTEILSFFNSINSLSIRIIWGLLIVIFIVNTLFLKKKIFFLNEVSNLKHHFNFELIFILIILILTFINSLIYPPNTLDAMAYHMPKVMHWIQNGNIDFYPTDDLRQLILSPFSEFLILHLYLIFDSDIFSNFVQWYSMFICLITISLVSKELGCNSKFQIFTVLFCSTLPMGILQSTSTQTDYLTAMWLAILVFFLIKYLKSHDSVNLFTFAFILALAILTKGTTYIFAFSFCIWIGFYVLFKNRNHFKYLFVIPIIVIIINFGHLSRNINFVGNPLGVSNESPSWLNKSFNFKNFTSNFVRNVGLNLSVPSKKMNNNTAKQITLFLNKFNISTKDPNTTKIPNRGYYIPFSFYESTAPNTLHFLLIIFSAIFFLINKQLNTIQKNYFYSVIFGFLFFSFLLIWTAQHNRLLLPFFILSSPLVSIFLLNLKISKISKMISIFLIFYSVPYVLFNKTRPLAAELTMVNGVPKLYLPNYLKEEKNEMYFIADKIYNKRNLYDYYNQSVKLIKSKNCKRIGFNSAGTNIEYPLWVILKQYYGNINFKLYNINVNNKSAFISTDNTILCAEIHPDEIKIY
jgi:hypothetical protein